MNSWPAEREGTVQRGWGDAGEKWHRQEGAGRCPGRPPASAEGCSLQGRVFLSMSMLCARSLGNWAPAASVPRQQPGVMGYSLPGPALAPRARFPPAVPSSLLGPCQRPRCQGRGDAAPVSPAGAGRHPGLFSGLYPCHPAAFVLGGPCRRCIRSSDAASPAETTLVFAKLTPQLFKTQNTTLKPMPHPISVSSDAFGNSRDGPTVLTVSSRSGHARHSGGRGKAALGQPEGHGCCPGTGLGFWAQLLPGVCNPGWVSAAGRVERCLSPRTLGAVSLCRMETKILPQLLPTWCLRQV